MGYVKYGGGFAMAPKNGHENHRLRKVSMYNSRGREFEIDFSLKGRTYKIVRSLEERHSVA